MLKKTMKYVDFDGNEREEDFYFNLTKQEAGEWMSRGEGGLLAMLTRIMQRQNNDSALDVFEEIILKSYGEKSLDGKYFMKDDEIRKRFKSTQAYSDLWMELASDDIAFINFLNGVLPLEKPLSVEEVKGAGYVGNNSPVLGTV